MDWRDLIEERKRRQGYTGFTLPTATLATTSQASEPEDDGGFFGGIGKTVENVGKAGQAVAGFFGNMVKDVVDTAGDAIGGIKDVVEGQAATDAQSKLQKGANDIQNKYNSQINNIYAKYQDAGKVTEDGGADESQMSKEDLEKIAALRKTGDSELAKYKKDNNFDQQTAKNKKETAESQKVDPLKTAAASGETFLNAATLGVGGIVKSGVKTGIKQGAKAIGKEILEDTAEQAAKRTAIASANRTAAGAAKQLGRGAFEGGAIGAGMGFLSPYADEGKDADLGEAFQSALMGGAIGGALGGAVPLLDKNVRAGVKQIPGAVREGTGDAIETAQRLAPTPAGAARRSPEVAELDDTMAMLNTRREQLLESGLSENSPEIKANAQAYTTALTDKNRIISRAQLAGQGGYIRVPFGPADDAVSGAGNAADDAARQLRGEELTPTDPTIANFIDDEASQYNSPKEYLDSVVDNLWAENKQGKGVDTWLIPDDVGGGFSGRGAVSNNSKFYQDYYREYGGKPTKRGIRDMVEQELTGKPGEYTNLLDSANEYGDIPFARDIYQRLAEREEGLQRTIEAGPPADMYGQFADDIGQPAAQKADEAIPRPISATPRENMGTGSFDSEAALQRALARGESDTNPRLDYIDRTLIPKAPERPGAQQVMDTATPNPYEGMTPDPNRLALPAGEIPKPLTPAQAKRSFSKDKEAVDFLNQQKPGSKPIELPANVDDMKNIAVRQTPGGKLKPLAKNNAHITTDDVDAIRAIAADDTSSAFTMTKTPEMNLEAALKNRGGVNSKEFRTLDKFNTSIREHTAEFTTFVDDKREWLERFIKEGGFNGKNSQALRPYLEAADGKASQQALDAYRLEFGDQAANAAEKLRLWWRQTKDQVRSETNDVIKTYAGEDRMMGDLGPTYVPRVYKSGTPGFKNTVLDVAHAGMEKVGGKKGLFNLENGTGYLSKESENFGGVLRNTEGIPLNSEFSKPNTTYLSAAQKRTANGPIKEMEDPITSMMRYFEATGRARYFTEDIARGQTLRDAIQYVNNETGNLRQMYKSFEDQVNSLAGKTARIDRPFVDSERGAQFVNVASKLQSRVARSTILGSVNSALAQTGQLPLIAAENGGKNFAGGMSDLVKFIRGGADDPMAKSAFMKTRYPKFEDMFSTKKSTRAGNAGTALVAKPFRLIEHAASELAWRSSYRQAIDNGFEAGTKQAVQEADRIAAKIVGERSPGARAALYESKALGPVTSYTLEVNQLYQVGKQYFKNDPKKAAKLVGAIWLYNQGYQAVTGNKLNADPLQATLDAGQILTDQNYIDSETGEPIGMGERLVRAAGRLGGEAIDATPLGGPVVGQLYPEQGFRVPFGGGARTLSRNDIFGDSNFGRYGGGTPLAAGISNPLLLLGIPGMAQAQRSVEGINAVESGASTTGGGDTRFLLENDPENLWRAILFGQYGTREGRAYLQDQQNALAGYVQ